MKGAGAIAQRAGDDAPLRDLAGVCGPLVPPMIVAFSLLRDHSRHRDSTARRPQRQLPSSIASKRLTRSSLVTPCTHWRVLPLYQVTKDLPPCPPLRPRSRPLPAPSRQPPRRAQPASARHRARRRECHSHQIQSNRPWCGGARAPRGSSGGCCSGPVFCRCQRIFAMTCASSTLAMIRSRPPQRAQVPISILNTRFSRRAQFIAT